MVERRGDVGRAVVAEVCALEVSVLERVGKVHDAARVDAVLATGDVAELVDGLGQDATAEQGGIVRRVMELGAESGEGDDGAAAVDGGLSEDEVQAWCVQVLVGDAERPASLAGPTCDERVQDAVGAVLSPLGREPLGLELRGSTHDDGRVEALCERLAQCAERACIHGAERLDLDGVPARPLSHDSAGSCSSASAMRIERATSAIG